jgi:hypothetical protein
MLCFFFQPQIVFPPFWNYFSVEVITEHIEASYALLTAKQFKYLSHGIYPMEIDAPFFPNPTGVELFSRIRKILGIVQIHIGEISSTRIGC